MFKIFVLRIVAFFLIFAVISFLIVGTLYYFSRPPFSVHDAGAYIETWLDKNKGGKKSPGETTLPNVCVWAGYANGFTDWEEICSYQGSSTDSDGIWSTFFAGGSCNEIFIAAFVPQGYHPTTPMIVNGCSAKFGFTSNGSFGKIAEPDIKQYLQKADERQNIIRWVELSFLFILISAISIFISLKLIRKSHPDRL